MKQFLKENIFYFIPFFLTLALTFLVLFVESKTNIHIAINKNYCVFADVFFKTTTFLGSGLAIPMVVIPSLFVKYRYSIISFCALILSGIVVFVLKQTYNMPRPINFFTNLYDGDYKIRIIENLDIHSNHSFPSGHTTTAFVVFTIFALITKSKHWYLKLFYFLMAFLVAYSRVYLSQHFLQDIVAGAIIGVASVLICYFFINKIKNKNLDKSLLTSFKKTTNN